MIPSCPIATLVMCHIMEVSCCYHSLLGSTLQVLSAPILWAFRPLGINAYMYYLSVQNVEFFCLDLKVSIATLLKNPSRLS
jgi:hypothetical protein